MERPEDVQHFTELFPIRPGALPELTAFAPVVSAGSEPARSVARRIGSRLTRALGHQLPGVWAWSDERLLTDSAPGAVKLMLALDAVRAQDSALNVVDALEEDYAWRPDPLTQAEFVVHGPVEAMTDTLNEALASMTPAPPETILLRDVRARGWVVSGRPSLSLAVSSRLLSLRDVDWFVAKTGQVTDLIGLLALDRSAQLQGEIIKVVGTLEEHRERLLKLAQSSEVADWIRDGAADSWVLRLASGGAEYDLPADALGILIRPEDAPLVGLERPLVERLLHQQLAQRAQLIRAAADRLKAEGLIDDAFSTRTAANLFVPPASAPIIRLGAGRTLEYAPERLGHDAAKAGFYQGADTADASAPMRIALLNALSDEVEDFVEAMRRQCQRDFGLTIEVARQRKLRVASRANVESAVRLLTQESVEALLAFLPDRAVIDDDDALDDDFILAQTIGRGQPCLVIHGALIHRPESMGSIIVALMARSGMTPFVLADPLPFADRVVGLTLGRTAMRSGDKWTGFARFFRSDGLLLGGATAQETVGTGQGPGDALFETLLPREKLEDRRVLLHLDGRFRRELMRAVGGWEDELNALFMPVEVQARGAPRLYALHKGAVRAPANGTRMQISDIEAILVTADDALSAAPPLLIRTEPPLTADQAVASVSLFTMLHYGALVQPRLPVTLHNADRVTAGLLRGVLDADPAIDRPFWL